MMALVSPEDRNAKDPYHPTRTTNPNNGNR